MSPISRCTYRGSSSWWTDPARDAAWARAFACASRSQSISTKARALGPAASANEAQQEGVMSMKPKVFVAQPIPEVALDVLREAAEVCVYPYMDRQISVDELVAGARRSDWLFVLHETNVTAAVINANPNLQGIGAMASSNPHIDMAAANARKIPVILENPTVTFPG